MTNILYIATDSDSINDIAPLWEKMREHHTERSGTFKNDMAARTWEQRRDEMREKARGGRLRVDLAYDDDVIIGYCICTISQDEKGEIDSIYVENDFRGKGVGTELVKRAETWFDLSGIKVRTLLIADGNEEVIPFYTRLGYHKRATVLQYIEPE